MMHQCPRRAHDEKKKRIRGMEQKKKKNSMGDKGDRVPVPPPLQTRILPSCPDDDTAVRPTEFSELCDKGQRFISNLLAGYDSVTEQLNEKVGTQIGLSWIASNVHY
jgi:hypothetical protein